MESTKSYSEVQETRVAKYLGWNTVVGSGARDFHPGDVTNDAWLGECKTHMSITPTLKFLRSHWKKIQAEALQQGKYPALIVDDGSQRLDRTWVMFPCRLITSENSSEVTMVADIKCGVNITFKLDIVADKYSKLCLDTSANISDSAIIVNAYYDSEIVGLVPISVFQSMFCN